MSDKFLNRHVFNVNEKSPGGESLILKTEFFDNGDSERGLEPRVFIIQELTLHSYFNSVSLKLNDALFTPEVLRRLADELEIENKKALARIN